MMRSFLRTLVGTLLFAVCGISSGASPLKPVWVTQLEHPVHAPPVITQNAVIATTANGVIYRLNRTTGAFDWRSDENLRYWDRSLIVNKNQLITGRSGGVIEALSLQDGSVTWTSNLGIDVQAQPLFRNNRLYVPTTHVGPELDNDPHGKATLFVLDSSNGEITWSKQTDNYAIQTPAFNNGILYLAGSYHDPSIVTEEGGPMRIAAISTQQGDLLWEYQGMDGFVKTVYADDDVVAYVAYEDFINGIDASSGELLWRTDAGNWAPSLTGVDGVIYYGSATTWVYALSSANGEVRWKFNIGGKAFNYLLGKPLLRGDVLYFLTQLGDIYALKVDSGELLWSESTGTAARTGLSVEDGLLVIGGIDGSVRAYQIE